MPNLTLEIELVAAVSGFRNGTLVNIPLPVSVVTAPWSADQEPVQNSMSSSRKQLWECGTGAGKISAMQQWIL